MLARTDWRMKRVLVTGAGTGIGRGIGLSFANAGAKVVFHYSQSSTGAEKAVAEARSTNAEAWAIQADFGSGDLDALMRVATRSAELMDGIDVLINNAGITFNMPFTQITPQQFDTVFNVNFRAQFFLCQAVVPIMASQGGGAIVNISSTHAFGGMTEHSTYSATKGAVVAFTREVALELIDKGIRVNGIAPGSVKVENHYKTLGAEFDYAEEARNLPAGFVAEPEDIAALAMFLAGEESRYIIGQTILCDGGQLAVLPLTGNPRDRRTVQWGVNYVEGLTLRERNCSAETSQQ